MTFNIIKFFDYDVKLMSLILGNRKLLLKYKEILLDDDFKNEVINKLDVNLVKRYNEIMKKLSACSVKNVTSKKTISPTKKVNNDFKRFYFG